MLGGCSEEAKSPINIDMNFAVAHALSTTGRCILFLRIVIAVDSSCLDALAGRCVWGEIDDFCHSCKVWA